MTDLTPLFNQCVNIVQKELGDSIKDEFDWSQTRKNRSEEYDQFTIKDTFIKESKEFYEAIVKFNTFIYEIKSPYLSMNEEINYEKSVNVLTIEDKNQIDQELNYEIQQMYEKLKILQTYETKRQEISVNAIAKKNWLGNIFGDTEPSDREIFQTSVSIYRTQILRFLNNSINLVNKKFDSIQRKRLQREKQLNSLNFQNFEDDDLNYNQQDFDNFDDSLDVVQQEEESYQQNLTQQQVMELETENKEFLKMKTNQLKQVEKLHSSMVEIINLQAELAFQLESQGDQISNLLDNQSSVEIDIKQGNINLGKATKRNKKGANLIITACIALGFLILIVDYISY